MATRQVHKEPVVLVSDIIEEALPKMVISHHSPCVQSMFLVAEGVHLLQLVEQHRFELCIAMGVGSRLTKLLAEGIGNCLWRSSSCQLGKHEQEEYVQ